jgi:hypothetical protein
VSLEEVIYKGRRWVYNARDWSNASSSQWISRIDKKYQKLEEMRKDSSLEVLQRTLTCHIWPNIFLLF